MRLTGGLRAPVNGLLFCDGGFIVSEGGNPGRLTEAQIQTFKDWMDQHCPP